MIFLFFLVVFAIGVLRPVRNAFALDGLADSEFYKVYFVSAIVVLFAPAFNKLSDRFPWKRLIPAVAIFFALNLVVFRFLYREGSTAFGVTLYGWYDLLSAALVTQFFMATQLFFNARDAKKAYPFVIAGGSIGATLGGAITGFFAERVGTANLLLVAAGAIALFAVVLSFVWARENPDEGRTRTRKDPGVENLSAGEFQRIFRNPHVRLIAATVLLTVLVKQLVDYEYNTLTKEVFRDVDSISAFQGKFYAATQWLPIVVLAGLRPVLTRWGIGVAVLIFPVAMLLTTSGLAIFFSLAAAVAAKGADTTFRYSAERTGREVLYVPVPDEIKLKAKAYIDVAMEKGVGKASSAVLLLALLSFMSYRQVALVAAGLAVLLCLAAMRLRREYVKSLAQSLEGRFASLKGTFVSLKDSGAIDLVRASLGDPRPFKVAFTLELLSDADVDDLHDLADDIHRVLEHPAPRLRARALRLLARIPDAADEAAVRARLSDATGDVREAAVAVLAAMAEDASDTLVELLDSGDEPVRLATLACIGSHLPAATAEKVVGPYLRRLRARGSGTAAADRELALAAGLIGEDPDAVSLLRELMAHDDRAVAAAAVESAGRLRSDALVPDLIDALGPPRTRGAARTALATHGDGWVGPLITGLNDPGRDLWTRLGIASVLGHHPSRATVDALITSYFLESTEQALDDRTLVALHRIRAEDPDLPFPRDRILEAVDREAAAAGRYGAALAELDGLDPSPTRRLLARALEEARADRRASAFRWLGLIFSQEGMHRSLLALSSESDRQRANAVEWLETSVGRAVYQRVKPLLEDVPEKGPVRAGALDALARLWHDEDAWIARLAFRTAFESDPEWAAREATGFAPVDPGLGRELERRLAEDDAPDGPGGEPMDLIEKVFLLQDVDLLAGARSQQLALLASIAREVEADADRVLIRRGDPTDTLFVVIHGEVSLEGMGDQSVTISDGGAFGTWALIDQQESLVEARARTDTRLLKISSDEFHDLLVDHPELGLDLLRGLARRVRGLATA